MPDLDVEPQDLPPPSNVIDLHASKTLKQAAYIEPPKPEPRTVGEVIVSVREAKRQRAHELLADAMGLVAEAEHRADPDLVLRAAANLESAASLVAAEMRVWVSFELREAKRVDP